MFEFKHVRCNEINLEIFHESIQSSALNFLDMASASINSKTWKVTVMKEDGETLI